MTYSPDAMDRADALMRRLHNARAVSEDYPVWALVTAYLHRHPDEVEAVLDEVDAKLSERGDR